MGMIIEICRIEISANVASSLYVRNSGKWNYHFPKLSARIFHKNDNASTSKNKKSHTSESHWDCRSTEIDGETEPGSSQKDETKSTCKKLLENRRKKWLHKN
jgi:hypothetical protein